MEYYVTITHLEDGKYTIVFEDFKRDYLTDHLRFDTSESALNDAKLYLIVWLEYIYQHWLPIPEPTVVSNGIPIKLQGIDLLKYESYKLARANNFDMESLAGALNNSEWYWEWREDTGEENPILSNDFKVHGEILALFGKSLEFRITDINS